MIQPRVNLIELSPKGTGKSFVFSNLSRYVRVISGGKTSAPVLFYNLQTQEPGLLTQNDLVVFDEAQTISFNNPGEVIGILKDYLESGKYSRGRQQATAEAGIAILGNIPISTTGKPVNDVLFENLPPFLRETAFVDRLHGIVPGWKLPRIRKNSPSNEVALKADYFSEVLHEMRALSQFDDYTTQHLRITGTDDMRDFKAIHKITTAYLKLLFPDLELTSEEFYENCALPAANFRQRIRDQLSKMDAEYKVVSIGIEVK